MEKQFKRSNFVLFARVSFVSCLHKDLKILSWEFGARRHGELLPRRLVAPQVLFFCASGERLVSAARDGDVIEAKMLLDCNPCLAKYSTFGGLNSPLHFAAAKGHNEVVLGFLGSLLI